MKYIGKFDTAEQANVECMKVWDSENRLAYYYKDGNGFSVIANEKLDKFDSHLASAIHQSYIRSQI